MKKIKVLVPVFALLCGALLFSSFTTKEATTHATRKAILNYAWYTTDGQFVAWSTLVNAEVVTDADTDPTDGTLVLLGYTGGNPGQPPSGTLVYKLYTHP